MDNYKTSVDLIIKAELNGKPTHEFVLLLGETPSYLVQHLKFPVLPLVIKASVISKACFDHAIPTTFLKQLPEIISNPKSVFLSANETCKDSIVVLTFEFKGQSPIIIPIRKKQQIGRYRLFNTVTSVYAKDGPNPIARWINDGLLVWKPSH